MTKANDFAAAIKKKVLVAPEVPQVDSPASTDKPAARVPSRIGKRYISAAVSEQVKKQLGDIANCEDTTVQALICEGINMVFIDRGRSPIADETSLKGKGK